MTAKITFSNLMWNSSLLKFFFRAQSEKTFNQLIDIAIHGPEDEMYMSDFLESMFNDVDDLEEYFYLASAEEIATSFNEFCRFNKPQRYGLLTIINH